VSQPPLIRARFKVERAGFSTDVDLALPGRGVSALFGHSGAGKTTILRAIAGLERHAGGYLVVNGEIWQDDAVRLFVPPHRRAVGYVFQEASLFPHLSVQGNLDFARKRAGAADSGQVMAHALSLLGIGHLLQRRSTDLSGGERQRVAIARAVASAPRLLLLDEPLASLDAARRQEVLPWLERLRDESRLPMLYVTHAADELARLADTVVVLKDGRALACGPTREVLAGAGASSLFGDDAGALLPGVISERDERWQLARVTFAGGSLWLRDPGLALGRAARLRVLARDVSIALQEPRGVSIQNILPCTVDAIAPDAHPSQVMVQLDCGGLPILARITARAAHDLSLSAGMKVWAQVKAVALVG
jgi:molybdate transport system ATP-binding protein